MQFSGLVWLVGWCTGRGYGLDAINILEGRTYPHHPVFASVPRTAYPLRRHYLTELNGLLVPARFDCESLCNTSDCPWGGFDHRYYLAVPSRWHACHVHEAHLRSGLPSVVPELPLVDDEYDEHVAIYESVLRARRSFVIVELGARWGTWGARAVAMLRTANPMPHMAFFAESSRRHCLGVHAVMRKNAVNHTLACDVVTPGMLLGWMASVDHVDVVDMDIQGYEDVLLQDSKVRRALYDKAHRLIIASHSPEIHDHIRSGFAEWTVIDDVPFSEDLACTLLTRGGPDVAWPNGQHGTPLRHEEYDWEGARKKGCFHETARGKVAQWDGQLVLDNPRLVGRTSDLASTCGRVGCTRDL